MQRITGVVLPRVLHCGIPDIQHYPIDWVLTIENITV